jgi:diaminopimelate epimerase
VVWFRGDGRTFRIWPAVEVLATASEYLESACGSASLALALWLWKKRGTPAEAVDVHQPSGGVLRVFPDLGQSGAAWLSGPVVLAAQGTAYL